MQTPSVQNQRTCPACGAVLEQHVQRRRSLIDIVGSSLLGLLVLGLALLLASIFGSGGGRYTLVAIVGIPAFIIWVLWQMVGSTEKLSLHCPSCGPTKE
jgi:ribosomal protein S27AE